MGWRRQEDGDELPSSPEEARQHHGLWGACAGPRKLSGRLWRQSFSWAPPSSVE